MLNSLISPFGGQIPRSRIAGSYSNSMFNILKNFHTGFRNSCTLLHSYQQLTRVPVFPHPHQHLFYVFFLSNKHPDGCEVISHGFDLYFSSD